mmetsp:Transcript_3386/g.9045  ORF Transcript_3386/g.9045 Transcript_3386/m.9045 type:complete len:102 (-) Transcript_3386:51-356(-)|eukprot:CAMPEP_0171198484 /NCGR_PEP_ID=MMETSP0790-20130122/22964_1 /TAXON_ID=2925 /ORGANISM="Alexandrium catenella, Strain OF101" /LENGTH=101 /DNA_ID=CAMNT_0011663785 /DNA_START=68 /DNA_END=373 /DNA_ORIENTATION=+
MVANTKAMLLPTLLLAVASTVLLQCMMPAGSQGTFVTGPHLRSAVNSPIVQVLPAAAVTLTPGLAEAATQQELNRFGFVFAVIFLLFFLAAFARLLTVGKL